jgi:prephenate dehydrogenase
MVPIIGKISIIGLGSIGKAIAEILSEKGISDNIYGYDIDNEIMGIVTQKGYIKNSRFDSIEDIVRNSEVIILAMPLVGYAETVNSIFPFIQENTAVIELTTVKSFINNNVLPLLRTRAKNLVQCNPILSFVKEKNTEKNKKPTNIFKDKKVLITPYSNTRLDFINKANWIFQQFDSNVLIIDQNEHDKIIANTLHFPYLLAFLYDVILRESKTYTNSANDYDDSFLEFRKLIKSSMEHWKEIFYYNSSNLDLILKTFHEHLSEIHELIKTKKIKQVLKLLETSFKKRVVIEGTNKYEGKMNLKDKQFLPNKKGKLGSIMGLPIIINHALIETIPNQYSSYLGDDFFDFTKPLFNYKSIENLIIKSPEKVLKDIKKFIDLITEFHILLNKKTLKPKDIKTYLRPSYIDE